MLVSSNFEVTWIYDQNTSCRLSTDIFAATMVENPLYKFDKQWKGQPVIRVWYLQKQLHKYIN